MTRIFGFFFLLILSVACNQEQQPRKIEVQETSPKEKSFEEETITRIDSFFSTKQKKASFNGTILFRRENSVYRNAYGFSRIRSKKPMKLNHRFQLASVSKPLTAVATLQLVEDGKIRLTDTVSAIIPGFPYKYVTIEMLLNHRSGLANYMYITDSLWQEHREPMCLSNAVKFFNESEPLPYYPVNKRFDYCNTNYMLLAQIIENVSGLSFEEYMRHHVFNPAGMHESMIYTGDSLDYMPELAIGHDNRNRSMGDYYLNGVPGDKSAYSTVDDLDRFVTALETEVLLSDSLLTIMRQPASRLKSSGSTYGLGWRIRKLENGNHLVFHHGWWRGYKTYLITYPKKNIRIIILTNSVRSKFLKQEELLALLSF